MRQIPTMNLSAYSRKMLIDGYIIVLDLQKVKAHTAQLQKIGGNLNQITKRINETGRIYDNDMDELKGSWTKFGNWSVSYSCNSRG